MENSTAPNTLAPLPTDELASYHSLLLKKVNDGNPDDENPDTPALMLFNGYYALNNSGAFFAIDTNMVVSPSKKPVYHIRLLISLDGVTSSPFAFTGTFDGTHLQQSSDGDGLTIALTFTRNNAVYGTTASFTGTIAMQGKPAVKVSGSTYNNPIPASLFAGDYSYVPTGKTEPVKVMSIGTDNQLLYDNGTNSGNLAAIPAYAYNLNMYYFSFTQADATKVKLVMGTAGTKGFACNDLSVSTENVISRSLNTIPTATTLTANYQNDINVDLINFSGFYQIPTNDHPLAFIAIQSQYSASSGLSEHINGNCVMISYSLDGTTSTGFLFDPSAGMTFDSASNTLSIPASNAYDAINITFTRQYNPQDGSLVSIKGNIGTLNIQGSTLLNPVPLSAFSGVTMTSPDGTQKLTISSNNITYTNKNSSVTANSIVYVPLMYIVAGIPTAIDSIFLLSLGTDGLRGLACIVTADAEISSVYAINGPE
ncbi:hypothetical protein ACX0HA_11395 [Flavobacterium hauense]